MRFKSQIITDSINSLISLELVRAVLDESKLSIETSKAQKDPKKVEALTQKLATKKERSLEIIHYLKDLQNRILENQTEESLATLLRELEGIKIQAHFVVDPLAKYLKEKNSVLVHSKSHEAPSSTKKKEFVYRPKLELLKQTINQFAEIHSGLNVLLASLQSVNAMNHSMIQGLPDNKGQINSPAIQEFTKDSTASNTEVFPDENPPAIFDLHRSVLVNGKLLHFIPTQDEIGTGKYKTPLEKLKAQLLSFLDEDESIRNNPIVREALCNAILKNGQSLQTAFTNEYLPDNHKVWPMVDRNNNELCLIADTEATYNWTLKNGLLTVDIELDVKSLTTPFSRIPSAPRIIDNKTGEIREYDPEQEKCGSCPTIIKYQASISFDTKPTANETLAVPQVNHYAVTVFHDQFQYTPTLTVFAELETKPKQATAPVSSNK
ncbi:MAG: hypothetical protein K2X50_03035 [Gammaproteobacteria bacterium]|nr:hypothetical protein [Gammaproteobacteria bacterium]